MNDHTYAPQRGVRPYLEEQTGPALGPLHLLLLHEAFTVSHEFLNFLQNAEREEFQDLSAAQSVVMEKSNVRIETARVDQVRLEVAVATESAQLTRLEASNAQERLARFHTFDERVDKLEEIAELGGLLSGFGSFIAGATSPQGFIGGPLAFSAEAEVAALK